MISYRGKPHHLGQRLYAVLLAFAKEHRIWEIILDTPKIWNAPIRFIRERAFGRFVKTLCHSHMTIHMLIPISFCSILKKYSIQ